MSPKVFNARPCGVFMSARFIKSFGSKLRFRRVDTSIPPMIRSVGRSGLDPLTGR